VEGITSPAPLARAFGRRARRVEPRGWPQSAALG